MMRIAVALVATAWTGSALAQERLVLRWPAAPPSALAAPQLRLRDDFLAPGVIDVSGFVPRFGASAPAWTTSRVWFHRGPLQIATFSESRPQLAIDCTSGCEFSDELRAGAEARWHLGDVGSTKLHAVFRTEAITTKWSRDYGWLIGLRAAH